MLLLEHNIEFTRNEAEMLNCHSNKISTSLINSKTISNIINFRYNNFPYLYVNFYEIMEISNIFKETYRLKIVIESLFSEN